MESINSYRLLGTELSEEVFNLAIARRRFE